ncbi:MAG: hypothetical protein GX575_20980 [Candidatus Anammoximicrobium sp.]|nr:hypothetical protein [Candidatus Anammoximicrobium sp.]
MAKTASPEELVREAIERALADPTPRKLHGTKSNPGIFLASSAAAKAAAQQCLEQELIVPCGEQRTKTKAVPLYGLAPAGIRYLLEHDPVRQLLTATQEGVGRLVQTSDECQQVLTRVQQQVARLQEVVQHALTRLQPPDVAPMLAAMHAAQRGAGSQTSRSAVEAAGGGAGAASPQLADELLQHVLQHKRQSPLRPMDLPQLFRFARSRQPTLSLGQFHDLVRQLADAGRVRLSPFTQAMYQLPEPQCAMIVGREMMYYVEGV